jgi:hypothetical protein
MSACQGQLRKMTPASLRHFRPGGRGPAPGSRILFGFATEGPSVSGTVHGILWTPTTSVGSWPRTNPGVTAGAGALPVLAAGSEPWPKDVLERRAHELSGDSGHVSRPLRPGASPLWSEVSVVAELREVSGSGSAVFRHGGRRVSCGCRVPGGRPAGFRECRASGRKNAGGRGCRAK